MNRRFLSITLLIAAALCAFGYFVVDRPLAEWVRASGVENAAVFVYGLGALDWISGNALSIWLLGGLASVLGGIGWSLHRDARWPRVLLAVALVQYATIVTMIVGKNHFARLRPYQVLASADWSHVWFAGGVSFPSGHSAFYFGFLLPLAATCPRRWQRALLLAIPVFAVLARIDLAKHFLSDVSMSACLAASYALIAASLLRHWLPPPRASSL
jgi:membrane-associated phospholipid phosphatase